MVNVRGMLGRLLKQKFSAASASELPYPAYWRSVIRYIEYHAGHISDRLQLQLINDAVAQGAEAVQNKTEPEPWTVPDQVKKIWEGVPEIGAPLEMVQRVTVTTAPARTIVARRRGRVKQESLL